MKRGSVSTKPRVEATFEDYLNVGVLRDFVMKYEKFSQFKASVIGCFVR